MRDLFFIFFTVLWLAGFSQKPQTVMPIDTTQVSREYWKNWMNDLLEMGIEKKDDSVFIKEEVVKLVKDSIYRKSIYPINYEWSSVLNLLKIMELKKAFWHLINVYMSDTTIKSRSMVLGTLVLYDSLIEMDKMLLNSYYTYAFTDPRVCRITDGKPDIYRPDLLEEHMNITKEIINNIYYYRRKKKEE
jgi:hypothetical protein